MLAEIFQLIIDDIGEYLKEKTSYSKDVALVLGHKGTADKKKIIRLELLRFGADHTHRNYVHESPADKSFYAFTFFITVHAPAYSDSLELTELVCDHFDKKPFIQVKIREQEYEVAISPLDLSVDELNHFWMARQQAHQPVLFFQSRISES